MPSVIILQRMISAYRVPVYRRLFEQFGWQVVSDPEFVYRFNKEPLNDPDYLLPYRFDAPDAGNPYRVKIPMGRILREIEPSAVIAEFSLSMSSTYDLVWRRRLRGGPAVIFWSHGYNMHRGLDEPVQRLYQIPRVVLSKLADGHLCYTQEGAEFLARYMSRDRIFVAHNTVDIAPMQALAKDIGRVDGPGTPHLLTIGRLTPEKNVPMLVRAFKSFRKNYPRAALTIIGDGVDADRTRDEVGDQLGKAIRMIGREYDERNLARHFCSADLVLFSGAVGLSVNHALAYGVPVMAFDRCRGGPGHGPEIAYVVDGVTGQRVGAYSEPAFASALIDFFERHKDPRRDFSESILEFANRHLVLDRMIEGFGRVKSFLERECRL